MATDVVQEASDIHYTTPKVTKVTIVVREQLF